MRLAIYAYAPAGNWKHDLLSAAVDLGHQVTHIPAGTRITDIAAAVRGADAFMWIRTHGKDPKPESHMRALINQLNQTHIRTIGLHHDLYWGLEGREWEIGNCAFWRCRKVWTADGDPTHDWDSRNVNHYRCSPAVGSSRIGRGIPQDQYRNNIAFTGQRNYPHAVWWHRKELITWLETTYGSRFTWYGPGSAAGEVYGQAFADMVASTKILIGDACLPSGQTHCHSDRLPITLARGGFVVHPRVIGVTDGTLYTEGEHLVCWDLGDWGGLRRIIDYYLAADDERTAIAAAGMRRVAEAHTWHHRLSMILSMTQGGI